MLNKQSWLYLAIAYTVFVTVVSLVKIKPPTEINVPQADKWVHISIYVVFTVLWFLGFTNTPHKPFSNKPLVKASIWAFLFGVSIEIVQHISPYARSGDFFDVLANTIGILIAVLIIKKTKISNLLNSSN